MKKQVAFQHHVMLALEDIERDMAGLAYRIVGAQHVARVVQAKVAKLRQEVANNLAGISCEKEKK